MCTIGFASCGVDYPNKTHDQIETESESEEESESGSESQAIVQKKPAGKVKFNVDSSDSEDDGKALSEEEGDVKRDKNDAAWFKAHESELQPDCLGNVMDAPATHPSHQQQQYVWMSNFTHTCVSCKSYTHMFSVPCFKTSVKLYTYMNQLFVQQYIFHECYT